ncbi:MAG: hypothetical protein DYH12_36065 [Sorangiineae bacterium PRO1]|nr:hypothetical protein [Sorangiineae bacterium PRO1]
MKSTRIVFAAMAIVGLGFLSSAVTRLRVLPQRRSELQQRLGNPIDMHWLPPSQTTSQPLLTPSISPVLSGPLAFLCSRNHFSRPTTPLPSATPIVSQAYGSVRTLVAPFALIIDTDGASWRETARAQTFGVQVCRRELCLAVLGACVELGSWEHGFRWHGAV